MRIIYFLIACASLILAFGLHATSTQKEFDLIIANGRIVDGTGNPWFVADLAIKDGRIAALGKFEAARAARTLDAKGLVVAPGFIDVHTHIEGGINERPQAENFLRMGVTSVVTGNCGASALDLSAWSKGSKRKVSRSTSLRLSATTPSAALG